MGVLEETARRVWVAEGDAMRERVALGFQKEGLADNATTWYELPNTADPAVADEEQRGEFFVEGSAIQRVLAVADMEGHREELRILWHTHVNTVEPSEEDIAEFPEWLAHYGMVYHVPTDTVTVYNQSGIISPLVSTDDTPLATDQE